MKEVGVDWLVIALRIVHIGAAVLWVGGTAVFSLYVEPTLNALGPDAEKVTAELVGRRRLPVFYQVSSTLAVLGGLVLYWRDSNGLQLSWIQTPTGLAFTIGGLAAIAAWLSGGIIIGPAVLRVAAIGAEMKALAGPPTPDLLARMRAAQERLRQMGLIDLGLLGVAVLAMASARYLA
jgi:uncharacterized membrane protein